MTDATPYTVPKEPGRWRAITLAAVVHAALLAFLWIGVRWQNETPVAVEAEVWSPQPREAAPRAQPQPEPEIKPEPKPVVKQPPKPQIVEPKIDRLDIALEQEKKKRKEQEKKKRLEEEDRLAKLEQKAEEQRIEKEKADAARKKIAAEETRKAAADKKRRQDAADVEILAKAHDDEMRRITSGVAGTGGAGEAPKAQGGRADASYIQKVGAKIKSNTVFNVSGDLTGNPPVEYAVELLPDGSVRGLRKIKSSGVPGFDEAVRRAIEKSAPFPPDRSGTAPASFNVIHKPKDQ
ncbi:MAG: tolA [Herminiimonas sp.]|nr:tolA [Herminiimonas sp.]